METMRLCVPPFVGGGRACRKRSGLPKLPIFASRITQAEPAESDVSILSLLVFFNGPVEQLGVSRKIRPTGRTRNHLNFRRYDWAATSSLHAMLAILSAS